MTGGPLAELAIETGPVDAGADAPSAASTAGPYEAWRPGVGADSGRGRASDPAGAVRRHGRGAASDAVAPPACCPSGS